VSIELRPEPGAACRHLDTIRVVEPSTDAGCAGCLRVGGTWVHLRVCMACGHVGCCDESPARHARGHAAAGGHPIVKSLEPGEDWGWCFVDEAWL